VLQLWQGRSTFTGNRSFIVPRKRTEGFSLGPTIRQTKRTKESGWFCSSPEGADQPEESDASLDEAARNEREYVRGRLREELKREPTEQELDEWLRQHTEGY